MWSGRDIPALSGKTAVVTGGNTGLGYETALALCRHGCKVVIACRSEARAQSAIARIQAAVPAADISFVQLDLADLDSVKAAAQQLIGHLAKVDILINNV